jgi:hypothetical protein
VQRLQPLRPHLNAQRGHARNVAARPVQAGDKSSFDRVDPCLEDDGNRRSRRLGRVCCSHAARRGDDGHAAAADRIGRQFRQPIEIILRKAVFDRHIPALDVAGFAQALAEYTQTICGKARRCEVETPDHRHRR